MNQPSGVTVSIIIPCYNASATVRETLDSVMSQTFRDFEIIAVDDGSNDDTGAILATYASHIGGRFHLLRQQHSGPYVSRNAAIANACGRYIAFLDSDDIWRNTKLEQQIRFMEERPWLGLSYTEAIKIDSHGQPIQPILASPAYRGYCFRELLVCNRIVTSSVIVRRAVFDRTGTFDEEFFARGDWEMWTRIAAEFELDYVPESLTLHRTHSTNMSQDIDKMRLLHFRIIEKNAQQYAHMGTDVKDLIREAYHAAYLGYGVQYYYKGQMDRARRDLLQAIRINPRHAEDYVYLLKSLLSLRVLNILRSLRRSLVHG